MRRISIMGDSISTLQGYIPEGWRVFYEGEAKGQTDVVKPSNTWWHRLISHYGAKLHANSSFSGSMVAGPSFPAGCSMERAEALARDGEAPDAVIIFYGINDYGWGHWQWQVNFGSPSAAVEGIPEVGAPEAGNVVPEEALAEFREGYGKMLNNIRTLYPEAEVWCCTLLPGRCEGQLYATHPYQLRGALFDDYNQAIRDAAAQEGCQVADVADLGLDYVAIDGTHPNRRGMMQIAAMIARAMENAGCDWTPDFELFLDVDSLLGTCFKSERRCDQTTCVGCEHAKGVGNSWWCVCQRDMI